MKVDGFIAILRTALMLAMLVWFGSPVLAQQPGKAPAKKAAFDASACYGCHAPVKALHADNKQKGVACSSCHEGLDKHLGDPKARPATRMEAAACGACHQRQFETLYTMNWDKNARSEKSQAGGPSPNPAWDKLMMGHGFTREHNVPRWHAYMLLDQYVVDRAFGGRFVPKDGWRYLARNGGAFNVNDRGSPTCIPTTATTSRSSRARPLPSTRCA